MAEREILIEVARRLSASAPLIAFLAAGALVAIGAEAILRRWGSTRGRSLVRGVLVAAAVGVGLFFAWGVLWLSDDAFISFRYARNLAEGLGLVYNEGEWVEGYTNFLWTATLGGLAWLGIDIPTAGLWGNLICFVATLVLASSIVSRVVERAVIPFAAIALACLSPFYVFASSGLETMPLAFLVTAAMWASTLRGGILPALLTSLILVAAAMTRPDHLLIHGCMGLAFFVEGQRTAGTKLHERLGIGRLLAYAGPLLLIYLPYFLIRWKVYGDPMPNTYYAKSGGLSYFSQGRIYLVHFLATTGAWFWLPLFLFSIFQRQRSMDDLRLRTFTFLSVWLYGFYIVKVGGDFMEHRFFVPLLPPLAITTELALRGWLERTASARAELLLSGAAALGLALAAVPVKLIEPYEKRWHLAAEHTFYPVKRAWPLEAAGAYQAEGRALHQHLGPLGIQPRLAGDAIGFLGYYSHLPIVDAFGLTSRSIGRKPLEWRGRPGHEKYATPEELKAEGAVLSVIPFWGERSLEETSVLIGDAKLYLLRPDPELEEALSLVPGVEIPKLEDRIRTLVLERPRAELVEVAPFYRRYLQGHPEAERLLASIEGRLGEIADFEEGSLPPGGKLSGEALVVLEGRTPLGGSGLGWLSSAGEEGSGTGRLEIPLGQLEAAELRFALGGGRSAKLQVLLVVDGEVVRSSSPRGGAVLEPRVWDLRELSGENATLVIEDADPAPGMGISVDGIHFASGDGDLRERIARWKQGAGGDLSLLLEEAEAILPAGDPDQALLKQGVVERWSFAARFPKGSEVMGQAFGAGPVPGGLRGQQRVSGQGGRRILNSFHGGDRSVGMVRLPRRRLPSGGISVLVGGGNDCSLVYVGLEVEGEVVERVCGRRDEILRRATLPTERWAGEEGSVVIVDEATGAWGHILAGDVIFMR